MRIAGRAWHCLIGAGAAALMLAGCSGGLSFDKVNLNPFGVQQPPPLRPSGAPDLVNAEGRCGEGTEGTGAGIALEMSECEVVARAGPAEKVEIGANARGERTATLSYLGGPRPGIYRFVAGRLTSIERVAEPAEPPKPARPKKKGRV